MISPCLNCTRVRDPQNCENKLCKDWQAWFIDRWEAMREQVQTEMEKTPFREVGVPLGGEYYASPHRVREYLKTDPCGRCLYPRNACHAPCPVRSVWSEKQNGVSR